MWRCLVPCCGYFEWLRDCAKVWHPFLVAGPERETLAMAGVCISNPEAKYRPEFAIVTAYESPAVLWLNNQQPVFVPARLWSAWLDPSQCSRKLLESELVPYSHAVPWDIFPVCRRVNHPRARVTAEDVAPRAWWQPQMLAMLHAVHHAPRTVEELSPTLGLEAAEALRMLEVLEDVQFV